MKPRLSLVGTSILFSLLGTAAWAQPEKEPDVREYRIGAEAGTMGGDVDGSQTFDRRFSVTFDGTCAADSLDSSNDGVGYQVFDINSPSGENLDAEVVINSLPDSVLFLYCDTFDPMDPTANLVAWDDDDGVGFGSAILPEDGVALDPNTTYQLVVTGFGPADLGTYDLILGGDVVFGPAGPDEPPFDVNVPTMGTVGAIALGILLALAGVTFLARRTQG